MPHKARRHLIIVVAALCALTGAAAKPKDVVERVPVTNVQLGAFPYFAWPAQDKPQNPPVDREEGHFLFWTGASLRDVAGKTHLVTVISGEDHVEFDQYATRKSFETAFRKAGAVKIASARLTQRVLDAIPTADRQDLTAGLGDPYDDQVETWLIRRTDRQIWINFTSNTAEASLAVVETPPTSPTSSPTPQ